VGDAKDAWLGCTTDALRRMPPFEFMRRLPLMYPRWIIRAAREWIQTTHCKDLASIMANLGRFSEFNFLGAWAWFHAHDSIHWTLADREHPPVPLPVNQFWSHGNLDEALASVRVSTTANPRTLAQLENRNDVGILLEHLFPGGHGVEIGVASTKAFTCQLSVLAALAANLAKAKGRLSADEERQIVRHLAEAPAAINGALAYDEAIEAMAGAVAGARDVLYLGRGTDYPLALEGALKLKEISYIHAEGYAAGEMKHGPIALIDESVPVIVIAPSGPLFEKTVSNMQEVQARGGKVILISDYDGIEAAGEGCIATITMPKVHPLIAPIVYAVPVQLLAYHVAVAKGTDVDQPRNLAKSVTVE
jgi:fructoselysine-6-P-deglycase FrlB-like protein